MSISYATLLFMMLSQPGIQPPPAEPPVPSLKTHLESYFRNAKTSDRAKAAAQIAENHHFQEVVEALPSLELWSRQPIKGEWTISLPSGQAIEVEFTVPLEASLSRPFPMVLVFSSAGEAPLQALTRSLILAGAESRNAHAYVALDKPVGGSFHQSVSAASDLPALLREIRRRIHIDVDRVFLLGESAGADAAWVAAMMYSSEFAGVIAISGIPRVPYPEQSYAVLLPNLRGTPFLSIWTDDPKGHTASPVPAVNKAIANFALTAGLPFETATLAQNPSGESPIPQRVIAAATSKSRQPQSHVQLWFRYQPQGNARWLRATDLAGDVWDDEQISIAVTAREDRDEFITETLKQKLFYINGRIDGQTITVETERIEGIELRLSPEQVDFAQPVTITLNGRQRFEGLLEPSIKDVLESAYEDWDFQHPVYTRKSFTINAKP